MSSPAAAGPHHHEATADGHAFEATLMPSGSGPHWLPLRKAVCQAIGKHAAGQDVAVTLRPRVG